MIGWCRTGHLGRYVTSSLVFSLQLCASSGLRAQSDLAGPAINGLRPVELPESVARASDVRWFGEDMLLLGVVEDGVFSWRFGEEEAQREVRLFGTKYRVPGHPDYGRLGGAGSDDFAFGNGLFGVYVHESTGIRLLKDVELVGDIDRQGSLTAAVGLSRAEDRSWEHHVAWLFDGPVVRPLLPTRDHGLAMALCYQVDLSVIRFLSEDRLLVIPGTERGVFVYDRSGSLVDSLTSESFFADSGCEIGEEQSLLLRGAPFRAAWLNRRRVIDEVVVDDVGNVFLFVRSFSADQPPSVSSTTSRPAPATGGSGETVADLIKQAKGGESVPIQVRTEQDLEELVTALRDAGEPLGEAVENRIEQMRSLVAAREPTVDGSWEASDYPPMGRVCWDVVHAHSDDFSDVTRLPCAIESEFGDARLRADLRGERAVVLLKSDALSPRYGRPSEIYTTRLLAPLN